MYFIFYISLFHVGLAILYTLFRINLLSLRLHRCIFLFIFVYIKKVSVAVLGQTDCRYGFCPTIYLQCFFVISSIVGSQGSNMTTHVGLLVMGGGLP